MDWVPETTTGQQPDNNRGDNHGTTRDDTRGAGGAASTS
jgi:hypothetical protein